MKSLHSSPLESKSNVAFDILRIIKEQRNYVYNEIVQKIMSI